MRMQNSPSRRNCLRRLALFFAPILVGCAGNPATYSDICWAPRIMPSPDGKRLCVAVERAGVCRIATMRVDGTDLRIETNNSVAWDSPAWSPDGRSFVYSGSLGINRAIFVLDRATGHTRQITHPDNSLDMFPSFSKDGKFIVFARSYLHRPYSMGGWTWNDWDVCIVKASGGGEKRLTHNTFYEMAAPYFSLDGKSILFGADAENANTVTGNIYEITLSNGALHPLTSGPADDDGPTFAPNGREILFSSDRGYEQHLPGPPLWVMDRRGGHIRQLITLTGTVASNVAGVDNPVYSPDGSTIYFTMQLDDAPHYAAWSLDLRSKNLRRIAGPEVFSDK